MIGHRIRALRKAKGWTLFQFSLAAEISAATLHRYESGAIKVPGTTNLHKMSKALGCSIDSLLERDEVSA
jgi:transcriptional regulator with XRE-family HTH domain